VKDNRNLLPSHDQRHLGAQDWAQLTRIQKYTQQQLTGVYYKIVRNRAARRLTF